MLMVKTRRTCVHGAGISSKPTVKAKGFKKVLLSSYAQDGSLITSTPRKRKADLPASATHPKKPESQADPQQQQTVLSPVSSSEGGEHHGGQTSVDSSLEDETIFSPGFHLIKTSHSDEKALNTEVTSNSVQPRDENHAERLTAPHAKADNKPLLRCTALSIHEAEATQQLLQPDTECPTDDSDDVDIESDDVDGLAFDPYLFIKRLPKLSDVVPLHRPHLLPKQTRRSPPKTLVLDLDETLVHSTMEICPDADFSFPVDFNNHQHTVYVRVRPFLYQFLDRVSQLFEVILFTASQSVYAERLLNILDPNRQRVQHRVFRDSCVFVDGNYLKDLTVLGRDLCKVAIVDNSPQAFGFQVDNGIPIESWFEDKQDRALLDLLPFLESLVDLDDVRPAIADKFKLKARIESACLPRKLNKKAQ